MTPLSIERKAQRLTLYIGESDRWQGRPLYAALLERLKQEGLAGATVTRGVAGFGAHSRSIHTASILRLSEDLPLVIEIIDSPAQIARALEVTSGMLREGLVTLEDVEVIAYTHRALKPLPVERLVREVMTPRPVAARADQPAAAAWALMLQEGVKALPVLDSAGRVVGVLADEDLLERAGLRARLSVARQLDPAALEHEMERLRQSGRTVGAVMSAPAVTVRADEFLGLAAERMVRNGFKRLPVVDEQGRLVGILSRFDLLRQVVESAARAPEESNPPLTGKTVGEVMIARVPRVALHTGLGGVIQALLESGQHRVIVEDEQGQAAGLITDLDVVARIHPPLKSGVLAALRGQAQTPPANLTAAGLMSAGVASIAPEVTLVEAIRIMLTQHRKWLVVTGPQGQPLGLIDRETALRAVVR